MILSALLTTVVTLVVLSVLYIAPRILAELLMRSVWLFTEDENFPMGFPVWLYGYKFTKIPILNWLFLLAYLLSLGSALIMILLDKYDKL